VSTLESPDDRFAYRIQYLDTAGNPLEEPTEDVDDDHPCLRLSVKRTAGVTVLLDTALANWGEDQLNRIVAYHEEEVHFDDVPLVLLDENDVYGEPTSLTARPATIEDILLVAYYLGEFVPIPQLEAMYEMRDVASLGTCPTDDGSGCC